MFPVFVTGGTGYVGRPLIEALAAKGYAVHALVRRGSEGKLAPPAAIAVVGDALDESSYAASIPPAATLVDTGGRKAFDNRRAYRRGARNSRGDEVVVKR